MPELDEDTISGTEKIWGVVVGILTFPIGLVATIGLLANRSWGRVAGVIFGGVAGAAGVVAMVWLLAVFLPGPGVNYPFAPWFVFLAGLEAVLGFVAARTFLRGLRGTGS